MHQSERAPSAEYWTELLAYESELYERNRELTPVLYPEVEAVEVWSTGYVEPIGYDTVAYSATKKLFRKHRDISLTMFTFSDTGTTGLARVYDLDLTPHKESLSVFPVYLKLSRRGLSVNNQSVLLSQRRMAWHLQATAPNTDDYEAVREQLSRGVTGIFSRDHPERDW